MVGVKCLAASVCGLLAMVLLFGEGAAGRTTLLQAAPVPAPAASPACPNPVTVNVTLEAFTGIWYEIGSSAQFKTRNEKDLACITARYSVIPDGELAASVRVRNEGYNTSSGMYAVIVGYATVVSPGRLGVTFFPGAPAGDYRIIYLHGKPKDKYEIAIVYSCASSDTGIDQGLFILSRTPELDDDDAVEDLLAYVVSQGIVFEANNGFVLTTQDAISCGRNFDT